MTSCSGLATSTRTYGMKHWGTLAGGRPPIGEETEDLALMLFGAENPPGCKYVAGCERVNGKDHLCTFQSAAPTEL